MADELSDRLGIYHDMPIYLQELGVLVGRAIDKSNLLSREESEAILEQSKQMVRQPVYLVEIPFEDKNGRVFQDYIRALHRASSCDVYILTPRTRLCGMLKPLPLASIDFAFPFDVNIEGILVFLTADLQDELLLDYSEGDQGQKLLEIEASGHRWGRVSPW